jgi:lipoyl(octanoyl) transferase
LSIVIDKWFVKKLGLVEYERAWRLQDRLAGEISAGKRSPTLLLLEHPPTYTFGRRGNIENLLWDEEELARRGISLHWVDRGGDVTYHGPGQLVGYPLLRLGAIGVLADALNDSTPLPQADYIGYIRRLEQALIAGLSYLGVEGEQVPDLTGVWVQGCWKTANSEETVGIAKIAAIGVKVDARGVSRHGFALNVNPDKNHWEGIVGCGLKDYAVASLADLTNPVPSMDQVMDAVISGLEDVFMVQIEENEDL